MKTFIYPDLNLNANLRTECQRPKRFTLSFHGSRRFALLCAVVSACHLLFPTDSLAVKAAKQRSAPTKKWRGSRKTKPGLKARVTSPIRRRPALTRRSTATVRYSALVSLLSWQDAMVLTDPSDIKYGLNTSTVGLCGGVGALVTLQNSMLIDLSVCGFMGASTVGFSTTARPEDPNYFVENNLTPGVRTAFGVLWKPGLDRVAIGISVPLVFLFHNFAQPTDGYQLFDNTNTGHGMLLELRLQRQTFEFIPKVGFYRSLKNLFWEAEMNFAL